MNEYFIINNFTNYDINNYVNDLMNVYQEVRKVLNITEELEMSLNIVTAEEQKRLNQTYRNKDYVADVLTFALEDDGFQPATIGVRHLGDIFICWQQAIYQAQKYEHSLRREVAFLFTHGMLHILGYDHIIPQEEAEMFGLQRQVLNNLGIDRKQEAEKNG